MFKSRIGAVLRKSGLFDRFFHKRDLRRRFYAAHGYFPSVRKPRTFNEKIYRRLLFDDDPRFVQCADKVLVKEFVAKRIGQQFLIPTLYSGRSLPPVTERNWPLPFVIKANHGSGFNVFVHSTPDWREIETVVEEFLTTDFGAQTGERFYSKIDRQVLVEPFMSDTNDLPVDYKFLVFNGEPKLIEVHTDRATVPKATIYDCEWKRQEFFQDCPSDPRPALKPKTFETMFHAASILARGFDFVRVDFYEIDGRPYFGEMTFAPTTGLGRFEPQSADQMLGEMWK